MKIVDVEAIWLRAPALSEPIEWGKDAFIVRIHTDSGLIGVGVQIKVTLLNNDLHKALQHWHPDLSRSLTKRLPPKRRHPVALYHPQPRQPLWPCSGQR